MRPNNRQPRRPTEPPHIEVDVTGLGHAGEGVGRHEGRAVFVPGALPGERIRVLVEERKERYWRGRLSELVAPHPDRVPPPCPVYDACGGCQLQHASYGAQLRYKRQQVADALERIGGFRVTASEEESLEDGSIYVPPCLPSPDPWGYRNKAVFPIGGTAGALEMGPYAAGTHRIVDVDECLIQHPLANRVLEASRRLLNEVRAEPYHERDGSGLLRHLLVRVALATGQAMAVFVTTGRPFPSARDVARRIAEAVPEVVSVQRNINDTRGNVILGERTETLFGRDEIVDRLGGLTFRVSARSFFQVNPRQAERLYDVALQFAALSGRETVVDAYCGTGTIALLMARHAARVVGIEVIPEAVEDARINARDNGLEARAEFRVGTVEDVLPELVRNGLRSDVAVLDPPRKGCEPSVLEVIAEANVPRIVYVSCNPATLARDLKLLAERGYAPAAVQPVDMFPHTSHVECCVLLTASSILPYHIGTTRVRAG